MPYSYALQRPQERDELLPLCGIEFESEFVALDGPPGLVRQREPARRVCVFKPIRVEHFLQARRRTVMQIMSAVPNSFKRWNLVVTGSLACRKREANIGANRDWQNIERCRLILWRGEALRECQLITRVQWRDVAPRATFSLKDLPAGDGFLIYRIRICGGGMSDCMYNASAYNASSDRLVFGGSESRRARYVDQTELFRRN